MSGWLDLYVTQARTSVSQQFQYRAGVLLWLIGLVVEPVIYLVVWSTIAVQQGGEVGGFTAGLFATYYIGWTLVRHMNITLTPFAWEQRIRQGDLSRELLRPLHPFHNDLGYFIGMKVIQMMAWVPIAIVLVVAFQPTLNAQPWQYACFVIALFTAFVMRFALTWALGLSTFWLTRPRAFFELYFTAELIFSGRLVPMSLMPEWVQALSNLLPFKWAFGFQLELLVGKLTLEQTLFGFASQAFWFAVGLLAVAVLWRSALRKYSAVGA